MPKPDLFSLLIGLSIGILLVFLFTRPGFHKVFTKLSLPRIKRDNSVQNTELVFRKHLLRKLEALHLAPNFCRLSDIYISQKLISNPLFLSQNVDLEEVPAVLLNPLSIAEIPELSKTHPLPLLTLSEALSGGRNIVIKGRIGCGKTTALAHLAIEILENTCSIQGLNNYLPIYIHVRDLITSVDDGDFEKIVVDGLTHRMQDVKRSTILSILNKYRDAHQLLLLIDGLDELLPDGFANMTDLISRYSQTQPLVQIVTTSGPFYVGCLLKAGFVPLSLTPPGPSDHCELIDRYIDLYPSEILPAEKIVLRKWLKLDIHSNDLFTTSIEIISKLSQNPSVSRSALDNYSLQISNFALTLPDLVKIADLGTPDQSLNFSMEKLRDCLLGLIQNREPLSLAKPTIDSIISSLVEWNVLACKPDGLYCFSQPEFLSILLALSDKNMKFSDLDRLIRSPLEYRITQLSKDTNYLANWLKIIDPEHHWYSFVILDHLFAKNEKSIITDTESEKLARTIASPRTSLTLKYIYANILYYTKPQVLKYLLDRFAFSSDAELISLISLFAGKPKITLSPEICEQFVSVDNSPQRNNYLLALINHPETDESGLIDAEMCGLSGKKIAELLAFSGQEGKNRLFEYSHAENANCRRNAVYGLRLLNEPWVDNELEQLNKSDKVWMVRDAAAQAMENRWDPKIFAPQVIPAIDRNPEIIKFATENKIPIPQSGFPGILLEKMVASQDYLVQLLGIQYLFSMPGPQSVNILRTLVDHSNPVREVAFYALQEMIFSE